MVCRLSKFAVNKPLLHNLDYCPGTLSIRFLTLIYSSSWSVLPSCFDSGTYTNSQPSGTAASWSSKWRAVLTNSGASGYEKLLRGWSSSDKRPRSSTSLPTSFNVSAAWRRKLWSTSWSGIGSVGARFYASYDSMPRSANFCAWLTCQSAICVRRNSWQ